MSNTIYQKQIIKQKGFTLVELLIVVSIMSFIILISSKYFLIKKHGEIYDEQINKIVDSINTLNSAASNYVSDNSSWPDEINNCADTINQLSNATPTAYLSFIDTNINFSFSCTTMTFTTSATMIDSHAAIIAANTLANATATANVVSSTVPKPEHISALTKFLLLDGSRAMTGDLDMGGNAITNTSHIATLDNRTIVKVETIAPLPTATILKPICPTSTAPTLNLAITGIVLTSSKIPYSHPPFIESQTPTQWTVRLNVFDEDGAATATTGTYVLATSSCN
jgi:prepilin-type N-terminal cleavage/methylation domain-containing protein